MQQSWKQERKKFSLFLVSAEMNTIGQMINRQLPQKIYLNAALCPVCLNAIDNNQAAYCPSCGQRLQWERGNSQVIKEKVCAEDRLERILTLSDLLRGLKTDPILMSLIDHFGSFYRIFEASPDELCRVKGVSPYAAFKISAFLPVYQMYEQDKYSDRLTLTRYSDLAAYCKALFIGANNELFYLLCFDAHLRLVSSDCLGIGTPNAVSFHPRLILETAMRHHASGVVLTHNHPGGIPDPSDEDIILTQQISVLLRIMEIKLYDHIIIAQQKDYSLKTHHWLEFN